MALASQSGPPQTGVLLRTHTARTSEPLPLAAWEPLSRDQRRAAQREGEASPCSLLMWAEKRWAEQQCSHPDSEARTTHSPPICTRSTVFTHKLPPRLLAQEGTGGREAPEMTPIPLLVFMEAGETRKAAEKEDRDCWLFWH